MKTNYLLTTTVAAALAGLALFQPVGAQADAWRIDYGGDRPLNIKCGRGSTAQWVRTQIFDQFLSR